MQNQEGYYFPVLLTGELGRRPYHMAWRSLVGLVVITLLVFLSPSGTAAVTFGTPTRSSTIALTTNNRFVVVANRQANSISAIEVVDAQGRDVGRQLAEIRVGNEPRFVALTPDNGEAYVTTAANNSVVVVRLTGPQAFRVTHTIRVGQEPRGIAVTPNGRYAFVANHTQGTVSVIATQSKQVINTVQVGGNPQAIAITNNGDSNDDNERVFVTHFFGEIRNLQRPDGFDDSKQGVVRSFTVGDALSGNVSVAKHVLSPLRNSGFVGDRRDFCLRTRRILQNQGKVYFNSGPDGNGDGASQLANQAFCPDPNSNDASATGPIANTPQGVYPNALHAALIRGRNFFAPNEGASPEPPVRFNVNVHYLVGVIDINTGRETNGTTNINTQVAVERAAGNTEGIDGLFGNTPGGIDANPAGTRFLLVSRGGNYVVEATLNAQGRLNIGAPNNVIRYQTGNMPTGVVMSSDGRRAYTNNEINTSVTALNLVDRRLIQLDINASTPPAPGTQAHRNLVGKLVFFTALGTPDQAVFNRPIRSLVPLLFRGKASDNAWSACASCHDDGRTDNVVWSFETGPRKSIDLSGMFGVNGRDQRILNWSAVRGSNTDFNNNARDIQGGIGFATNVGGQDRSTRVFNHGPVTGVSDALDALQAWPVTIRPLNFRDVSPGLAQRGRALFAANCAACHGGEKWTKSRTSPVYINNPTYLENPIGANFFLPVPARDPRLVTINPQLLAVVDPQAGRLNLMDVVGTFNPNNPIELRGAAAIAGQSTSGFPALGVAGFNSPSLLNVAYHAPFFHNGSAPTLDHVFNMHRLPQFSGTPTINQRVANAADRVALKAFLNNIDGGTGRFVSDTDRFLD